jgi:hypothetical protein
VPSAYDYKYYEGVDLLDLIEDGFYDDYDPKDCYDVQKNNPLLGP